MVRQLTSNSSQLLKISGSYLDYLVRTRFAVDLLNPLLSPGCCTPKAWALTPRQMSRTRYVTYDVKSRVDWLQGF